MSTVTVKLPGLDWKVPIVDPFTGVPTPYLQKQWLFMSVKVDVGESSATDLSGVVHKGTSTGWGAATGTGLKTTFATYEAPTISNPPTQAEVQAVANAVQSLSQHMKALIDAGLGSGLLAP